MSAWHQHLSESVLTAILTRSGAADEHLAHFIRCIPCQRKALELPAADGSPILRYLMYWMPLVRQIQEAGFDLEQSFKEGNREIARVQELVERAAASDSPGEVLASEPADCHSLALAVLRVVPGLRLDHPARIVSLCRHALAELARFQETEAAQEPAFRPVGMELESRLLAELGNAQRVLGHLEQADLALQRARALAESTASTPCQAQAFNFSAAFMEYIGQYDLAEDYTEKVISLYSGSDDGWDLEIARFRLATLAFCRGDLEEAERRFRSLLETAQDPLTELSTAFRLAKTYAFQGNPFAGADLLRRVRKLAKAYKSSRSIQITIRWLQALILGGTRSPLKGAELLSKVREHYIEREMLLDAALASVDLSMLLLQAGERRRAADVAAEALESFKAQPVDFPQALAALRVFEQAVRTERLCHTLYRDTALQLSRSLDRKTRDWVRRKYG